MIFNHKQTLSLLKAYTLQSFKVFSNYPDPLMTFQSTYSQHTVVPVSMNHKDNFMSLNTVALANTLPVYYAGPCKSKPCSANKFVSS